MLASSFAYFKGSPGSLVTFGGRSNDLGIAAGVDAHPETFQDEGARSTPVPEHKVADVLAKFGEVSVPKLSETKVLFEV